MLRTIPTNGPPRPAKPVQTFLQVEGVAWSVQRFPTAVNLGVLDRSRYYFFQVAPHYPHEPGWTPFQTHYFTENVVEAEIEPGTSGCVVRNSGSLVIRVPDYRSRGSRFDFRRYQIF
jgi:hypothetical protein